MRMWTRPSLRKRQHKALLQLSLSELRHEALGLGKLRPSLCGGASGGLASRRSFICPRSLRRLDRRHVRALVKTRMQLHPRRRPCKRNPTPASHFRRARGYPAAYARRRDAPASLRASLIASQAHLRARQVLLETIYTPRILKTADATNARDRACVSTTARRGGASNAGDPQPQHRHRKSLSAPEGRSNLMRMWTRPSLRKRQHKALLQLSLSELRHEALGLGKLRPSLCGGASGGLASRRSFICPRSLRRLDRRHVRALVKTRMQLHFLVHRHFRLLPTAPQNSGSIRPAGKRRSAHTVAKGTTAEIVAARVSASITR